jgi:hypothetical protein
VGWSYLHGDYDLKDVIVKGHETDNQRQEGKVQGAKNYTPLLTGMEFETIRKALNDAIGVDMVQHGAEAQFAWHGDEPITVILPDGPQLQFKVLGNAEAVQRWYIELNREVIAKKGKDYIGDKSAGSGSATTATCSRRTRSTSPPEHAGGPAPADPSGPARPLRPAQAVRAVPPRRCPASAAAARGSESRTRALARGH